MYSTRSMATRIATLNMGGAVPGIRANRQQIDDRFPVLGFTIDAAGMPFYEVILTTDPKLFDARRETERTLDNFHSSRADCGLIEASATIYIAPTAVVRRFAPARAIFYTLIGYADRALVGAAYAHDPATLADSAPSVQIAAGFQGRTLANVLGVPSEYLRPVAARTAHTSAIVLNAEDDLAEGEDGYNDTERAQSLGMSDSWEDHAEQFAADDDESTDGESEYDIDPVEPPGDGYDDGFGNLPGTAHANDDLASAAESVFPAGSEAPPMLEDEDDRSDQADAAAPPSEDGYGEELAAEEAADRAADLPFDIPAKRQLLEQVLTVAGPPDGFATTLADVEYSGRMGAHPAHGKYHRGLSYGVALFNQDSGELGALLSLMNQRDGEKFRAVFGPHAEELIVVTTRVGAAAADSSDGRGMRVQPVGGEDLWSSEWIARFKAAAHPELFGGGHPQLFNGAQNELAVRLYLDPMLPLLRLLGLKSQRAIGLVFDRALQMGVVRATRWTLNALSPIQGPAQRQQALAAVGHTSVAGFQQAHPGVESDGEWGPLTHAALLAALRRLGPGSPVPLPEREIDWLASLQRRAAEHRWAPRLEGVFRALGDAAYAI